MSASSLIAGQSIRACAPEGPVPEPGKQARALARLLRLGRRASSAAPESLAYAAVFRDHLVRLADIEVDRLMRERKDVRRDLSNDANGLHPLQG